MFSIRKNGTMARQSAIQHHTADLEVGQNEDQVSDEDGHDHGKTPIGIEAG
jgi:hypothetical protein